MFGERLLFIWLPDSRKKLLAMDIGHLGLVVGECLFKSGWDRLRLHGERLFGDISPPGETLCLGRWGEWWGWGE